MEKNYLGNDIPKLGFGLMRLPMKDGSVDLEHTKKMVDMYMERGFTYYDTAYVYINGTSEVAAREAIVKRYPREKFQLATKLPIWLINEPQDMEALFSTSMERAGVDYFDFYLLHGLNKDSAKKVEDIDAWGFVARKKAEGKIKHIGFSFHDSADVLDSILKAHPETEFVQLQINYADWESENVQAGKCYEVAVKYNVPVIIMEPVKGGSLVTLREDISKPMKDYDAKASLASWALRFCGSLDGIITILSGMSDLPQVDDNTTFMKDIKPLTSEEHKVIEEVNRRILSIPTIPCTDCKYCVEDCPEKINIPGAFSAYNYYLTYNNSGTAGWFYNEAVRGGGKASQCIECGSCESHCPQHIKIIDKLKEVANVLEK